jgi:hypothetical protein
MNQHATMHDCGIRLERLFKWPADYLDLLILANAFETTQVYISEVHHP